MSETVTNPSTEIAIREVAAVERALLTGILPDQVEYRHRRRAAAPPPACP